VDVSGFLQERLFEQGKPLVFTSATLAAGRSFDYFKQRMGVWAEVEGIIVESPFDFENQALLYVPAHLPTPMDRGFPKALADEVERLLDQTRGRAFVLFTSYRNLNYVAEKIGRHLPWPCLVQGDAPRHTLLENFRNQTDSVLLATSSFWQGVDVPGETLSAVIIDKLPFPRPDRPLVKARSSKLKEEGRDPFIRTQADRGVLAILDSRLVHRNYGPKFIKSLPPHRLTHDPADLGRFLNQ
jgi:ATP-dependent DNA helicase DinG